MKVSTPPIFWENGQGDISQVSNYLYSSSYLSHGLSFIQQLRDAGLRAANSCIVNGKKVGPNLLVVVLPEDGNDIYTAVKQYVYFSTRTACASLT